MSFCSTVYPSTFTSFTVYLYSFPVSRLYLGNPAKLYFPSPVTFVSSIFTPSLYSSIVASNVFISSTGVTQVLLPPIVTSSFCSILFVKSLSFCSTVYPSIFTSFTVYTYSFFVSKSYLSSLLKLYEPFPLTVVWFTFSPSLYSSIVASNVFASTGATHVFVPSIFTYSFLTISSVGFIGSSSFLASAFTTFIVSSLNGFIVTLNVTVATPGFFSSSAFGTFTFIPFVVKSSNLYSPSPFTFMLDSTKLVPVGIWSVIFTVPSALP